MEGMFDNCISLTSLDLSEFSSDNLNDMSYMFAGSTKLKSIKFGDNFNTNKVITMYNMFYGCLSLTDFDLSSFDTTYVINMSGMFYKCQSITSLELSNFNTNRVQKMEQMFSYCSSLEYLDISDFDSSSLVDKDSYLFLGLNETGKVVYNPDKFDDNLFDLSNLDWEKETYPSD